VLRFLLNFCRRPSLRFGAQRDLRGRFRDPRFLSFIAQTNRSRVDTDLRDAALRGRKLARKIIALMLAAGGAWVVIESAKALTMF